MKSLVTKFIAIFVVVFSLLTTGCPQKSIDQAKKSSAKIATYANTGVNVTRDLYRAQLLSLPNKDKIADGFIALAKAGQTFDAAVLKIEQQYGPNAPPKAEIDKLFAVFDAEVVDRLVEVLRSVGLSGIPEKFREIVNTLKSAVIIVAKVFGHAAAVRARLEVV
jgi:hypothetical protein